MKNKLDIGVRLGWLSGRLGCSCWVSLLRQGIRCSVWLDTKIDVRIGGWTGIGRVLDGRWSGVVLDDLVEFGLSNKINKMRLSEQTFLPGQVCTLLHSFRRRSSLWLHPKICLSALILRLC